MSSAAKSFYLTTPIYYVNDAPHIGHAYTTVAGDLLTRWHRQKGESVWFLTGTDEHGQKVMRTAESHNTAPQQWCDRLVEDAWKPVWKHLEIANDDFIRTTEPRHMERVQKFLQGLMESGFIYEGKYEGPYCVGCEEFKLPGDLDEGKCKIHSISISRSTFDWGIPVPWDTKQVVYVWFDALLNYATAVGLTDSRESDAGKFFEKTWPADVHLVGKDILRFHAVIWPAMLMAANLPVPKKVFAHGWLLVGGEKMSKSKLTGIAPSDITNHFGVDAFRYYFMRAIPFGSDGSFSWEDMSARYTSELANDFGNLASRLAAMVEKYCDGVLPGRAEDAHLKAELEKTVREADRAICALDFQSGINSVMDFCKSVNGYVTSQEPWSVAKDVSRKAELDSILYNTAESLRALAILLHPIMPISTQKLWSSLGAADSLGEIGKQKIADVARWGQLIPGTKVSKGEILFPRLPELES